MSSPPDALINLMQLTMFDPKLLHGARVGPEEVLNPACYASVAASWRISLQPARRAIALPAQQQEHEQQTEAGLGQERRGLALGGGERGGIGQEQTATRQQPGREDPLWIGKAAAAHRLPQRSSCADTNAVAGKYLFVWDMYQKLIHNR